MTPMGHSLTGATIALLALPRGVSRPVTAVVIGSCVVAASIPDWPLPGWGHDNYLRSHSALVTVCGSVTLAVVSALVRWWWLPWLPRLLPLCLALCWCSHLVLDSMYAGTPGLIINWPFKERLRLALPVPWLHTLERANGIWTWYNLRVVLMELVTFGPVLAISVLTRGAVLKWTTRTTEKTP